MSRMNRIGNQMDGSVEYLEKIKKKQLRFSNSQLRRSVWSSPNKNLDKDLNRKMMIKKSMKRFRNQPTHLKEYRSRLKMKKLRGRGSSKKKDRKLFSPKFVEKQKMMYQSALQRSVKKKVEKTILKKKLRKYFEHWRNLTRIKEETRRRGVIIRTQVRCRMFRKYFTLWKEKHRRKVVEKYEQKLKMKQSSKHYDLVLKKRTIRKLASYRKHRIVRRKLDETAYYFYYRRMCSKALRGLQAYVILRKKKKEINEFAHRVYMINIRRKYLKRWARRRIEMEDYRKNLKKAEHFHIFLLKRRGFLAFKKFVVYKKKRREENEKCKILHQQSVTRIFLRIWKRKYETNLISRLEVKEIEVQKTVGKRIVVKAFKLWKTLCMAKVEKRESHEKALDFHRVSLLRKVFQRLQFYRNYKFEQRQLEEYADKTYKKRILYRWRTRLRARIRRNEKKLELENFANNKILRKYLDRWFVKRQQHIDSIRRYELAMEHYEKKTMSRMFRGWRSHSHRRRHIRKLKGKAEEFRSFAVLSRFLGRWRKQLSDRMEMSHKMDRAEELHNEHLQRRVFLQLKRYAKYSQKKKIAMAEALNEAKLILKKKKKKRIFLAWRNWQVKRQYLRIKLEKGRRVYLENLTRRKLQKWRERAAREADLREVSDALRMKKYESVLQKYLTVWRERTEEKEQYRKDVEKAGEFYEHVILKRGYFKKWGFYIQMKKHRKKLKLEALERRRRALQRRGAVYFMVSSTEQRKNRFIRNYPIDQFKENLLLEKYALHWRYMTMEKLGRESFGAPSSRPRKPIPRRRPPFSIGRTVGRDSTFRGGGVPSESNLPASIIKRTSEPSSYGVSMIGSSLYQRLPPRRPVSLYLGNSNLPTSTSAEERAKSLEAEKKRILREIREEVKSAVHGTRKREEEEEEEEGEGESEGESDLKPSVGSRSEEAYEEEEDDDEQESDVSERELSKKNKIVYDIHRIEEALQSYAKLRSIYFEEKEERKSLSNQIELLEKLNLTNEGGVKSLKLLEYEKKLSKLNQRAKAFLEFRSKKIPKMKELLQAKRNEYQEYLKSQILTNSKL